MHNMSISNKFAETILFGAFDTPTFITLTYFVHGKVRVDQYSEKDQERCLRFNLGLIFTIEFSNLEDNEISPSDNGNVLAPVELTTHKK